MTSMRHITVSLLALQLLTACSRDFINYAELRTLEERKDYFRLPVVFIPGIKGTSLVQIDDRDRKHVIWGYSGHVAGFSGFGALTLDYERQVASEQGSLGRYYRDRRIYPDEVLMYYRIGWKALSFHDYVVYREMRNFLLEDGRFREGESLFLLPYDWRLDNRVAAVRLALALPVFRAQYERSLLMAFCGRLRGYDCTAEEIAAPEVRNAFSHHFKSLATRYPQFFTGRTGSAPEIRFHVVAHSMGGLVAQYFMAQLGGSRDVYNVVTLGTPTKGAMDALKALVEGEYPETLWSNLMGVLLFEKRSTNAITASLPATFQLLPRYDSAVEGLTLADLGLKNKPSELTPDRLASIVRTYREYGALPRGRDISRALGRDLPETAVEKHFQAQLLSAACFHAALDSLDGDSDAADEHACRENTRVVDAVEFLREGSRNGANVPGLAIEGINKTIVRSAVRGLAVERRVVYGGHCTETVSRAKFDPAARRVSFLGSSPYGDPSSPRHYGDGRVPFESAQFKRHNEKWATSFFLCTDHVDLVKDDSFKYNLLRALLGHWE